MTTHSQLQDIANTIRGLSMDAIESAGCGHPGLPLGCAEIAAVLFGKTMSYNPKKPDWVNRDRFILSAGHGSMLQYACLHLAGYNVSLDDLKNFRKYHSPTAGHPEYREIEGVETTTGPLGQGVATGIGIALGHKIAAARLGVDHTALLDNTTYILAGDGCLMEGISAEASALAGHLQLDNVVLIYDSNDICLDGPTSECHSEDTKQRYESYGWDVRVIDGHDLGAIEQALEHAKSTKGKPSLVIAKTKIGKGSPNFEGTSDIHGKAMGAEEVAKTKEALGMPEGDFIVPESVSQYFEKHRKALAEKEQEWDYAYTYFRQHNPEIAKLWDTYAKQEISESLIAKLAALEIKLGVASRASSNAVIQFLSQELPYLIGGSADLSCSDSTFIKASAAVTETAFGGQNIKYGVREFAMSAMASGLVLQGMIKPFIGTFFTFSDYMKNGIRLAALMKLPVIYQFTHDSIFLGEDGPTHQPVEHLAALRAMPNLTVIRPADATEVKAAWAVALQSEVPTALILSRQGLRDLEASSFSEAQRGAYIVKESGKDACDIVLVATGAEVALALDSAAELEKSGRSVRVVSMPSFELFNQQPKAYQDNVIPGGHQKYCVIEAASSLGWHQYIGRGGLTITVDTFGLSAPEKDLRKHFGFTTEAVVEKVNNYLG